MKEEASAGNPFNTTFLMKVVSHPFVGAAEWECDIKDFIKFTEELTYMYEFRGKYARLECQGYDSYIEFTMNALGHMKVNGKLVGGVANCLTFNFDADQTSLYGFIMELERISCLEK